VERVGGRLGENRLRLHEVVVHGRKFPLNEVVDCLGNGSVILMHGVIAEHADTLMEEIATAVGLQEELELQAGFAAFLGHRTSVGRFFMTVNSRSDFQFIGPHSEGDGNINMPSFVSRIRQMAARQFFLKWMRSLPVGVP